MHVFASQAELVRGSVDMWCYQSMDPGSCGLLGREGMGLRLCGDREGRVVYMRGGLGGLSLRLGLGR